MNLFWILLFLLWTPLALFAQKNDAGLPRRLDLRSQFTRIKNQGSRQTCSYFVSTALVEAEIKRRYKKEYNLSEQFLTDHVNRMCRMGMLSVLDAFNCEVGDVSSPDYIGQAISQYGLVQEAIAPYRNSSGREPRDTSRFDSSLRVRLQFKSFDWGADSMTKFLAKEHKPLAINLAIYPIGKYSTNWNPSGLVRYNEHQIDTYLNTLSQAERDRMDFDYHYAIVCGYDLDKKVFMIRNSMGTQWGQNGYGTIAMEDLDEGLRAAFYLSMDSIPPDRLPEVKTSPRVLVKNMKSRYSVGKNQSIKISMTGIVEHLGPESIEVWCELYAMPKGFDMNTLRTDENGFLTNVEIERIALKDPALEKQYHARYAGMEWYGDLRKTSSNRMRWDELHPLRMTIPDSMIRTQNVQRTLSDPSKELLLQVNLYGYNDLLPSHVLHTQYMILEKSKLR